MSGFQKFSLYLCLTLWMIGLAATGIVWNNEIQRIICGCICIFGATAIILGKFLLGKLEPNADTFSYEEYLNNLYIAATIVICLLIQFAIRLISGHNYHLLPLASSAFGAFVGWLVWSPEANNEMAEIPRKSAGDDDLPNLATELAQALADEAGDLPTIFP